MSTIPKVSVEQRIDIGKPEVRFAFGKNWQRFLGYLNEERIADAEKSLCDMLGLPDLRGKSFLDIGCGSGLFSLAAMRLGAARVHSFDYDPQSVACGRELKQRYFPSSMNWNVEQGSVLDANYLCQLGQFDVVYSWGVLHHTGDMWQSLKNVATNVAPDGRLFIALYNDQEWVSGMWRAVKRIYSSSAVCRPLIIAFFGSSFLVRGFIKDLFFLRKNPLRRYTEYKQSRGMFFLTDLLDWLGGYPFEVARPEGVFDFFRARGFELTRLKTAGGGLGNNEFVFRKRPN